MTRVPTLETDRLRLREPRIEDAAALAAQITPEISQWVASWPTPFTSGMALERILAARKAAGVGLALTFVIEDRGTAEVMGWIGVARAAAADRKATIGYWLGESHHGKGLMREAASAVIAAAFREMDLNIVEAAAQPDNRPTQAVLLACGLRQIGHRWIYVPAREREEYCVVYQVSRP